MVVLLGMLSAEHGVSVCPSVCPSVCVCVCVCVRARVYLCARALRTQRVCARTEKPCDLLCLLSIQPKRLLPQSASFKLTVSPPTLYTMCPPLSHSVSSLLFRRGASLSMATVAIVTRSSRASLRRETVVSPLEGGLRYV